MSADPLDETVKRRAIVDGVASSILRPPPAGPVPASQIDRVTAERRACLARLEKMATTSDAVAWAASERIAALAAERVDETNVLVLKSLYEVIDASLATADRARRMIAEAEKRARDVIGRGSDFMAHERR